MTSPGKRNPAPRRLPTASFVAAAVAGAAAPALPAAAGVLHLIGYDALEARDANGLMARGAGVPVAQVEVPATGTTAYAPDTSGGALAGKVFTYRTGPSGASGHASGVASYYYGDGTSPAPAVDSVALFSADGFIADLLRTGRSNRAPGASGAQVINNSWIASYAALSTNTEAVRRLDDLVNRDDVLVFNAVGNSATESFPKLLASSYNGVAVGTMSGSKGPFVFDSTMPRIKPDLVVDVGLTSYATALASGAGALLRSEAAARDLPAGQLGVKAMLMAGARRDATWRRGRPSGKDNQTAPLDFQQGAGQLRVDHAFDILTAGRQPAGGPIAAAAGWDQARTGRTKRSATYLMHVDAELPQWAAVLTWNRVIAGLQEDGAYDTAGTLADMDLSLYLSKRGGRRLVARSDSPTDNVETLTLTDLAPGDYQLVLTTDVRTTYGLAWYADPDGQVEPMLVPAGGAGGSAGARPSASAGGLTASAVPEPSALLGGVLATAALLSGRRRFRARS